MSTIIYLDSQNSDDAAQLAADLVDAMSDQDIGSMPGKTWVIADAYTCLTVGLAALGRAEGRTVEGGDRRRSSVTIVPIRAADDPASDALIRRFASDHGEEREDEAAGGGLEDLALLGAVEDDERVPLAAAAERSAEQGLQALIRTVGLTHIVVLAGDRRRPAHR